MAEAAVNNPADALSSPGSANGRQQWEQNASHDPDQYTQSLPSRVRTSHDSTATYSKYKTNFSYPLNSSSMSRASSRSGSRHGYLDQGHLVAHRVDALSRKDNTSTRNGSDADSVLDFYGRESSSRSVSSVMEVSDKSREINKGHYDQEDPNESHWIHRDKLIKIETEELQQYGMSSPDSVLLGTVSGSINGRSRESLGIVTNGIADRNESSMVIPEDLEHRDPSPNRLNDSQVEENDGPTVFDDPRLPEEIAADPYEEGVTPKVYRMPHLRTSSSRIPVLASSPHPIQQEYLERDSPPHRTRNNTLTNGNGDGDGLSIAKTRRPSQSAPRTLQTPEPKLDTTSPQTQDSQETSAGQQLQSSPSRSKQTTRTTTNRKASNSADTRKTSATQRKGGSINGSGNGNGTNHRPGTRSGDRRPGTAINRPEGDPPWLATMYKPDPRLPPDQQMLPTHAKRLQQELWEKEGKIPSAYDKDFAPISIRNDDIPPAVLEQEKPKEEPVTVQPPPSPIKSPDPSIRPGTSGQDRGGYKTIPAITSVPPAPTFVTSITATPGPKPMPVDPIRPVKEKSCSCCVVM
ncbi:hypothetical protein LOZ65_003847 [Ophidiomyces ophidiicola]|nr:hypothetical protein LOZ65_003847 [Ophidiomyces ophidiicola]